LDWTATDEISVVMLDQFFFQAEDGIRDFHVTGVQTCALPISGCRIIMIHADPTLYFLKKQGRFRRWLTLRLLAKVDAMLHPAHPMQDLATGYFPKAFHGVFHLYVDTRGWKPLPSGGMDFLCIGRADHFKNQELLVRALYAIREKHGMDVRLHVVGNIHPTYESTLRPLLGDSVSFTGWKAHPWEYLPAVGYYFNLCRLEP